MPLMEDHMEELGVTKGKVLSLVGSPGSLLDSRKARQARTGSSPQMPPLRPGRGNITAPAPGLPLCSPG
uniref:Uncharacterized protein n=1 Tax=Aegilops tauschii subsp. strangulata TaxID=200361 RepID=A0A452XTM7_AEGTS